MSAESKGKPKPKSEVRYPYYDLEEAIRVARCILEDKGGSTSDIALAPLLGLSTKSSGLRLRLTAARLFGLLSGEGSNIVATERARAVIYHEYPEDETQARILAFLEVPLFKAVYERYSGQPLPSEQGLKNAMRDSFHIIPSKLDLAYKIMMDSARQANLVVSNQGRTYLSEPRRVEAQAPVTRAAPASGVGTLQLETPSEPAGRGLTPSKSLEEARLAYLSALIEKVRSMEKVDAELLDRIERLLGQHENEKE